MNQSSIDILLQKYLSGECTEEEEKIVLEWYEKLISKSELHLPETEKSQIESRLWQAIQKNVQDEVVSARGKGSVIPLKTRTWLRIAAAACILALTVAGIVLFRNRPAGPHPTAVIDKKASYTRMINETAAEKKLVLSDGTMIILQPGASVDYPPVFTGDSREVYLAGSAFFQVHHDPKKRFRVLSGALTTEVLGTTFNIVQHKTSSRIEVAVVTGKVWVFSQEGKESDSIILTPNKKAIFNTATRQFTTGLVANPQPLLKTGVTGPVDDENASRQFIFEDEPLQVVLQELSKAYGISITTDDEKLGQYHFTGNISKYDLYKQLDIICQSTQSVFEIKDTQIILKENR